MEQIFTINLQVYRQLLLHLYQARAQQEPSQEEKLFNTILQKWEHQLKTPIEKEHFEKEYNQVNNKYFNIFQKRNSIIQLQNSVNIFGKKSIEFPQSYTTNRKSTTDYMNINIPTTQRKSTEQFFQQNLDDYMKMFSQSMFKSQDIDFSVEKIDPNDPELLKRKQVSISVSEFMHPNYQMDMGFIQQQFSSFSSLHQSVHNNQHSLPLQQDHYYQEPPRRYNSYDSDPFEPHNYRQPSHPKISHQKKQQEAFQDYDQLNYQNFQNNQYYQNYQNNDILHQEVQRNKQEYDQYRRKMDIKPVMLGANHDKQEKMQQIRNLENNQRQRNQQQQRAMEQPPQRTQPKMQKPVVQQRAPPAAKAGVFKNAQVKPPQAG